MRTAEIERNTNETSIFVNWNLDGTGKGDIETGIPFMDHMLTLFARHGGFDLTVRASGDLNVDCHHTMEDLGLTMGHALTQALGAKEGIRRYGNFMLPMDESLCRINVDISGRPYLVWNVELTREYIGDFETEMLREFFIAFTSHSGMTIHVASLYGVNNHHIVEGIFKGFGRALKAAVAIDPDIHGIPSTKGVIE